MAFGVKPHGLGRTFPSLLALGSPGQLQDPILLHGKQSKQERCCFIPNHPAAPSASSKGRTVFAYGARNSFSHPGSNLCSPSGPGGCSRGSFGIRINTPGFTEPHQCGFGGALCAFIYFHGVMSTSLALSLPCLPSAPGRSMVGEGMAGMCLEEQSFLLCNHLLLPVRLQGGKKKQPRLLLISPIQNLAQAPFSWDKRMFS